MMDGIYLTAMKRFSNKNDFTAAFHEGGIIGVSQDDDDQDYANGNENSNP